MGYVTVEDIFYISGGCCPYVDEVLAFHPYSESWLQVGTLEGKRRQHSTLGINLTTVFCGEATTTSTTTTSTTTSTTSTTTEVLIVPQGDIFYHFAALLVNMFFLLRWPSWLKVYPYINYRQ